MVRVLKQVTGMMPPVHLMYAVVVIAFPYIQLTIVLCSTRNSSGLYATTDSS